jgi:hypothetical protein
MFGRRAEHCQTGRLMRARDTRRQYQRTGSATSRTTTAGASWGPGEPAVAPGLEPGVVALLGEHPGDQPSQADLVLTNENSLAVVGVGTAFQSDSNLWWVE